MVNQSDSWIKKNDWKFVKIFSQCENLSDFRRPIIKFKAPCQFASFTWGQRVISVCTKTPITEKMRFILIKNWMWKRRAEKSDPRKVGIVAFFPRTTMTSKATPLHCVSHVSFLLSEYKSIIPHWWQFISAFDVYYTVLQVNVLKARYTDRNTAQKRQLWRCLT